MTLVKLVYKYRDAKIAFNDCLDMLKSARPISVASRKISDDFFGAREELFVMSVRLRSVSVEGELADVVRAWGAAYELAQGCPQLVNDSTCEAARRMQVLGDAEDTMLSQLS